MSVIHDQLSSTLSRALSFRLNRANMLSANLANIDTPGYTPVELQFDRELRRHLDGVPPGRLVGTHPSHVRLDDPLSQGEIEFDTYALPDQKGNSVDLDHEAGKLSENQLLYQSTVTAYNRRMKLLQHVIIEGGS